MKSDEDVRVSPLSAVLANELIRLGHLDDQRRSTVSARSGVRALCDGVNGQGLGRDRGEQEEDPTGKAYCVHPL